MWVSVFVLVVVRSDGFLGFYLYCSRMGVFLLVGVGDEDGVVVVLELGLVVESVVLLFISLRKVVLGRSFFILLICVFWLGFLVWVVGVGMELILLGDG